jgi:hypothetical protein
MALAFNLLNYEYSILSGAFAEYLHLITKIEPSLTGG